MIKVHHIHLNVWKCHGKSYYFVQLIYVIHRKYRSDYSCFLFKFLLLPTDVYPVDKNKHKQIDKWLSKHLVILNTNIHYNSLCVLHVCVFVIVSSSNSFRHFVPITSMRLCLHIGTDSKKIANYVSVKENFKGWNFP